MRLVHGLVVGIGLINKDIIAQVPAWERDQKTTASLYLEQVGGPVPVALMTLARFGMDRKPLMLGVVGDDPDAAQIARWLGEDGVEAARLQRAGMARGATAKSLVVLDARDASRTLVTIPSELPVLDLSPERRALLSQTRLLHLDGRDPEVAIEAAKAVKSHGGIVSLDLGTMRPGMENLLPLCDIVIASQRGGEGAFPRLARSPGKQAYEFLRLGAKVAAVTLGRRGFVIGAAATRSGQEQPVQIFPAIPTPDAIDTCGAGDVFHGAFLWAYLKGMEPLVCAAWAQAAASLRIRKLGNRAGIPTRDEVLALLSAAPVAAAAGAAGAAGTAQEGTS